MQDWGGDAIWTLLWETGVVFVHDLWHLKNDQSRKLHCCCRGVALWYVPQKLSATRVTGQQDRLPARFKEKTAWSVQQRKQRVEAIYKKNSDCPVNGVLTKESKYRRRYNTFIRTRIRYVHTFCDKISQICELWVRPHWAMLRFASRVVHRSRLLLFNLTHSFD